jgi:hypothetical protein
MRRTMKVGTTGICRPRISAPERFFICKKLPNGASHYVEYQEQGAVLQVCQIALFLHKYAAYLLQGF